MKAFFVIVMAAALVLGESACRKRSDAPSDRSNSGPGVRKDAKARLNSRYARAQGRLDSLQNGSPASSDQEQMIFARLLQEARTRRDHTQTAIQLMGEADTADPADWEIRRALAERSMDSLELSVLSVDSAYGNRAGKAGRNHP